MAKVVSAGPSGDVSKWHTIYPQYLNSNLTVELGRRLAKSKCVPDPTTEEIYNVLSASSNFEVQAFPYKCYCREEDKENLKNRGYVKYLCNDPNLKKKRDVLAYVAMTIPKLKSRQNQKASEQKTSGGQTAPPIQSSNAGGGGKKKNRRK